MKSKEHKHVVISHDLHSIVHKECKNGTPKRLIGDRVEELIKLGYEHEKNLATKNHYDSLGL